MTEIFSNFFKVQLMPNSCHALFYHRNSSENDRFIYRTRVPQTTLDLFERAKQEIRHTLIEAFKNWTQYVGAYAFANQWELTNDVKRKTIKPKFRLQGSQAYNTANAPAQRPQQADYDYGMYIPTSFLIEEDKKNPGIVTGAIFHIVERALQPLLDRNPTWSLKSKNTCIRIELSETAHFDLTIYAVSDAEYAALHHQFSKARDSLELDTNTLSDYVYEKLRSYDILLAHKESGWIESDPRKLEVWFKHAKNQHGDQLVRVCRYIKAWRDHTWEKCKLSSIALMVCVVNAFEAAHNREDKAIQLVARKLPDLLSHEIENPVFPARRDKNLDAEWSPEERHQFIEQARFLSQAVSSALDTNDKHASLAHIQACFGERIPPKLQYIESEIYTPRTTDERISREKDRRFA